jgi:hypothetical protein
MLKETESLKKFNPHEFYKEYPLKVILRPGYPARAQYKSLRSWELYGERVLTGLDKKVQSYADIGGCFGFGANAMAYYISRSQGFYPETKVFELSQDFINIGKQLFPYIEFIKQDFNETSRIFDLVTLFDVIEHIPEPIRFLSGISNHCKFALLKTPMETGGDLFGSRPPKKAGNEHPDGHINFFTPKSYLQLLKDSGFEVVKGKFLYSSVPFGATKVLFPERYPKSVIKKARMFAPEVIPYFLLRKFFGGGVHICLVKSVKQGP